MTDSLHHRFDIRHRPGANFPVLFPAAQDERDDFVFRWDSGSFDRVAGRWNGRRNVRLLSAVQWLLASRGQLPTPSSHTRNYSHVSGN